MTQQVLVSGNFVDAVGRLPILILRHTGVDLLAVGDGDHVQIGLAFVLGRSVVQAIDGGILVALDNGLHLHGVELLLQDVAQTGGGDLGLGGDDGAVGGDHVGVLHHLALQSVVHHLSGVVTGQVHGGVGGGDALVQVLLVGLDVGVDLPVGAHIALDVGIVADGDQQHLGGLGHGHSVVGGEGAVTAAGHDAQVGAVLDVRLGPVAHGVGVAVGHHGAQLRIAAAVQDDADHLSHFGTGDDPGGIIGAVVLTVDDVQASQNGDGLFVDDVSAIAEIINAHSAGADDHHAKNHDGRESQAESPLEVSHLEFLLLKFEVLGRKRRIS